MRTLRLPGLIIRLGQTVTRVARKVWHDHLELLDRNPAYRRQLEAGTVAILGACALHPTVALVTTVAVTLFVAAHESEDRPWRPRFGGPTIRRDDPGDWEY